MLFSESWVKEPTEGHSFCLTYAFEVPNKKNVPQLAQKNVPQLALPAIYDQLKQVSVLKTAG